MTTISLKMPNEQIKYLKKMTHYLSIERDEDLSFSDLVREAVTQVFPMPKDEKQENQTLNV